METQRPGTYDEKEPLTGVISFADRRLQNARCLLWVPVLFSGVVLYFLNIHSELYYYGGNNNQLLPESAGGAALHGRVTNAFLVDSPACRIPALDPWDAQVLPFLRTPRPLDCREAPRIHGRRPPPLVRANASALIVESGALSHYGLSPHAWPRCCYRHITRGNSDNDIRISKNRTYFEKEVNVGNAEFLRVECYVGDGMIYEDYHSFVPRKPEVEERCLKILRSSPPDEDALSVLLVGIDSVSRLNMHRHMPKTLQRLEKMGAIELLGYNKVGDNTFPNIVPLLSGFSVQELRAMCWFQKKNYFDSCRFLWNDLSEMGYRTSFGEDATGLTVFNYLKSGFRKQPTDYYLRTFMKPMEDKIGHKTLKRCVGSKMTVEVLLDYLFRFLLEFRSGLTYSFFWSASLTHDSVNNANYADVAYADLLRRLEENRLLERTALLVLSDHGMRWGDIRRTYQGRLEERLPLAFLVLPDWFRERYPAAAANAGRNARRLTSPFDLHATLRDVVRPRLLLTQDAVRARSLAVARASAPPRGISLFLQIPVNRSCEDAGILPNWCTCQINIAIDKGSSIVNRSANVLVDHINDIVRNFSQCYQLKLEAVIDGQLQIPRKKLQHAKDPGIKDYLLVVRTSPGNALFESTIRHKPKTDKLTVIGYVSSSILEYIDFLPTARYSLFIIVEQFSLISSNYSRVFGDAEVILVTGEGTEFKLTPAVFGNRQLLQGHLVPEIDRIHFPDLRGRKLIVSTFECPPFGYDDGDGMELLQLRALSRALNFRWEREEPPADNRYGRWEGDAVVRGGINGALSSRSADVGFCCLWMVASKLRHMDVIAPWGRSCYTFLAPRPRVGDAQSPWKRVLKPFQAPLWTGVAFALVLTAVTWAAVDWRPLEQTIVQALGVLLGTSFPAAQSRSSPLRALLTSWSCLGVLLVTAYGSCLVAHLTVMRPPLPFEQFWQLVAAGFRWGIHYEMPMSDLFNEQLPLHQEFIHRAYLEQDAQDRIKQVEKGNYVVFGPIIGNTFFIEGNPLLEDQYFEMVALKECLSSFFMSLALQRWSPLTPYFNIGVMHLQAGGIINYWIDGVTRRKASKAMQSVTIHQQNNIFLTQLSLSHLSGSFFLLGVGLSLSMVVFIAEILLVKKKLRTKLMHWNYIIQKYTSSESQKRFNLKSSMGQSYGK